MTRVPKFSDPEKRSELGRLHRETSTLKVLVLGKLSNPFVGLVSVAGIIIRPQVTIGNEIILDLY